MEGYVRYPPEDHDYREYEVGRTDDEGDHWRIMSSCGKNCERFPKRDQPKPEVGSKYRIYGDLKRGLIGDKFFDFYRTLAENTTAIRATCRPAGSRFLQNIDAEII